MTKTKRFKEVVKVSVKEVVQVSVKVQSWTNTTNAHSD